MLILLWLWFSPPVPVAQQCSDNCAISDDGTALITRFEGFSPYIYKDSAGYDTIGTGHLIRAGEHFDEPLLGQDATNLLKSDLMQTERGVNRLVTVLLWQNQYDALCSLTFNIGSGSLQKSNLLRKVNKSDPTAQAEFSKWIYAGGVKLKGLVLRRTAEASLYGASN